VRRIDADAGSEKRAAALDMASLTRESAAGVEASAMALIRYYSAASLRPIALASKKLLIWASSTSKPLCMRHEPL
jgi:hypothetical protein